MTPRELLAMCREHEIRAVNLRFMDFPGTLKHLTIPLQVLTEKAFEEGDVETLAEVLHDDFTFTPHVGDTVMRKADVLAFAGNDMVRSENNRILYENDEIGVAHGIAHFSNGSTSEAVLSFLRFKT